MTPQKRPDGGLKKERSQGWGDKRWRPGGGSLEGLEEWGACSFKSGNPSPVLSLPLLLTLWAAKSPGPGWGTPFLFVSTPLPCDVMAGVGSPIPGS